jgi:hypothetical protein
MAGRESRELKIPPLLRKAWGLRRHMPAYDLLSVIDPLD